MQLGEQAAEFRKRGYGVAGLTYDSPEILRDFSKRVGLDYILLSDPKSKVIRAFDILNEEIPKGHEWYGVPHPGMYLIDAAGVVRAKFFEESVVERYTAGNVLHSLDADGGAVSGWAETEHLKVTLSASDYNVLPGNRITLLLRLELKPGMHVYAHGAEGYKPVQWEINESAGWKTHAVNFPKATELHLPVIRETVPVYTGSVFLSRDLTLGQLEQLVTVVTSDSNLTVKGVLRYQACDDKECYRPREVPLQWTLRGKMHDSNRAPETLRK